MVIGVNGNWSELLPPTDEGGWEFVLPNPSGGFVWKRRVDTGKPFLCIKCHKIANEISNYCEEHKPKL